MSTATTQDKPVQVDEKFIKVGRQERARLMAARYFGISLLLLAATGLAVDRVVLPILEDNNILESYKWTEENRQINHFMYLRNRASSDLPIWRSAGMPVSVTKTRSKRILVMGDSFVWGDGYTNANTLWWKQLEKELLRRGYDDVEVVAAGLCGASTRMQVDWLKKLVPAFKPDLVIMGYVTNDPDELNERRKHFVSMIPKEDGYDASIAKPLERLFPNLAGQLSQIHQVNKQKCISGRRKRFEYGEWELELLKGPNFESYKATVKELSQYLKESKVPGFVLALPSGFQNKTAGNVKVVGRGAVLEPVRQYHIARYQPVKPVFQDAGLTFVDTLDDFISQAEKDPSLRSMTSVLRLGINPGNGHPGPFATHFYAVKAADELESKYPQALGAKRATRRAPASTVTINDWVPSFMGLTKTAPNTFQIIYPPDPATQALYMPMRKRHVLFNLAEPIAVKSVQVSGPAFEKAEVYATFERPDLGYDDGTVKLLGSISREKNVVNVPADEGLLNTIRLKAHFNGEDRKLSIKINPR